MNFCHNILSINRTISKDLADNWLINYEFGSRFYKFGATKFKKLALQLPITSNGII